MTSTNLNDRGDNVRPTLVHLAQTGNLVLCYW
jgi:hypothetical protein